MPNPRPNTIAAGVSTEDVRRAFYASPLGDGWSTWIEEMQLDPLQLIVMDDDKAVRSRVPIVVGDGDGADAVTFGDPVAVAIRYDDVAAAVAAESAPRPGRTIRYATRAESRPTPTNAQRMAEVAAAANRAKQTSPAASAAGTAKEGAGMDPAKLREGLGLGPDSSDEELNAALLAAGTTSTTTPAPTTSTSTTDTTTTAPAAEPVAAAVPKVAGTMTIDASAWDESQKRIKRLEAEAAKRANEDRDLVIAAAVKDGKFSPARREHWKGLWDKAPEQTREVIAGLQKNVIPVESVGFADDSDASIDEEFAHLYPPVPSTRKGR